MFYRKLFVSSIFNLTKLISRKFTNKPDFTKNVYEVQRGLYNYLQESHVEFFESILGKERVITDQWSLEKYNIDWFLQFRGSSSIVLKPKSTEEVSKILEYCNYYKLAVCPQGGNTTPSGGSVPVFDEVIISMESMNNILQIDEYSGSVFCESGITLQQLDDSVSEKGFIVPLDLGSRGSCQIGGNVASNAGGMRLLRYGNLQGNVLGLEIVKASGEILNCIKPMKKDNSGLHLKNLFIGSEGTLGIITKVVLQCASRPKSIHVALLGLQNYEKTLKTLIKARKDLGETLSAIEVMDAATMEFGEKYSKITSPIGPYPFYLIVEISGSNEEHDIAKLHAFTESALNEHYILNGIIASDLNKINSIWSVRENIPSGFKQVNGWMGLYDVSVPVKDFYNLVDESRQFLKKQAEYIFGFGHLGDGNLHLNIFIRNYDAILIKKIEKFLLTKVVEKGGSISAEHGLGFLKSRYLPIVNSRSSYQLMKDIKRILDPNRILNPYKVFP